MPTTISPLDFRARVAQIVDNPPDDIIGELDKMHRDMFAALGDSPDAIAQTIAGLGIKGSQPDPVFQHGEISGDLTNERGNALARALRLVCGADEAAVSTHGAILVWTSPAGGHISHESVLLPEPVAEFQRRYQDFKYPQLFTEPLPDRVAAALADTRVGIERLEHTVRGPVRQVVKRQGKSEPLTDEQIAAIGAARLTADDFADSIVLYRNGRVWALVGGCNYPHTPGLGHWTGRYGYLPDQSTFYSYQGLQSFDTRDEALRHVLDNVATPRIVPERLAGGRFRRGPLTTDTDYKRISDRVVTAAHRAGLTLDQVGGPLSQLEVFRDGALLATVGMIPGGTWQAELTDGRTLTEPGIDTMLLTTIGVLAAA